MYHICLTNHNSLWHLVKQMMSIFHLLCFTHPSIIVFQETKSLVGIFSNNSHETLSPSLDYAYPLIIELQEIIFFSSTGIQSNTCLAISTNPHLNTTKSHNSAKAQPTQIPFSSTAHESTFLPQPNPHENTFSKSKRK